jgi:sugar phosphate isomerase/epimerase
MSKGKNVSRRKFIINSSAATAGVIVGTQSLMGAPAILKNLFKPNSIINGVQLGVVSYSYRSLPDQSAEATLKYILESGMSATELMGGPAETFAGMPESTVDGRAFWPLMRKQRNGEKLTEEESKELAEIRAQMDAYKKEVSDWRGSVSMSKFEQINKMYKDAGVSIYAFKPRAFGKDNTDVEIDYGFRAAKALGASHVTLEHPGDDAHTLKLGKMAKKHKIKVAYHGHEQQTPTFWDTALEQSKYNSMNPDMGHYIAAGNDQPLDLIKKHHKRISSMHLKDRQTPANGKANLLWGTGDTPIPEILGLLKKEKYKFPASIEMEYDVPEGSDAIKEVARCLDFCAKILS